MVQMLKTLIFCFIFLWYRLSLGFLHSLFGNVRLGSLEINAGGFMRSCTTWYCPCPHSFFPPQNFYILNWFLFAWMMMFICINSTLNVPAAASTTNNSTNETKWKHYSGKRFLFLVWKRLEIHHQNESIIR